MDGVTRVYALAFTPDGKMLLVGGGPGDPGYWLPGGGIEDGETPESALSRELFEEAAATVHEAERLGTQRVDDPTDVSLQALAEALFGEVPFGGRLPVTIPPAAPPG